MLGVILLVLIIINWLLYHKFVHVIYFGSMRKSITNEFIWATIAAIIELALIMTIGHVVLIVIVIIGLIIGFVLAFKEIYKFVKEIKDVTSTSKANKTKAAGKTKNDTNKGESTETQSASDLAESIQKKEAVHKEILKDNNVTQDAKKEVRETKCNNVFCTSCGKKIPENSKFCTFCGAENSYRR